MDGIQLLLERALSHSFNSTDDEWGAGPAFLQKKLLKRKGMILWWNQGSRSWEIWPVSMVYHSRPAMPCSLIRAFRAMHGCLIWKPPFPSLRLPPLLKRGHKSPHFSLGCETEFPPVWQMIWEQTSLLAESPYSLASSSSSNLPEISAFMWDQHAGPNIFPLASERSERQYIESLNILITQLC